jgi:hypothetical protein
VFTDDAPDLLAEEAQESEGTLGWYFVGETPIGCAHAQNTVQLQEQEAKFKLGGDMVGDGFNGIERACWYAVEDQIDGVAGVLPYGE